MKKIIAAALLAVAGTANADFISANRLYQYMTSNDGVQEAMAIGYVQGIYDSNVGSSFCPPERIITQQVYDMTKAQLQRFPEQRTMGAKWFVVSALMQAWPCRKAPASPSKYKEL